MDKYLVSSAPYLRSADHGRNTRTIMRDLMIALAPVILFAIYKNVVNVFIQGVYQSFLQAIYPLITLIVSPIFSVFVEALCLLLMKKDKIHSFDDLKEELKVSFGMFPGLFICLISPVYIKMWVLLTSIAVGVVFGKMVFGGFGQNIFNPALVGRAFMAFAFSYGGTSLISVSAFNDNASSFLNAYELSVYEGNLSAFAGATPLIAYSSLTTLSKATIVSPWGNLWTFFLGMYPGALGETSALACLIGYIYLTYRKVIDYKIPLIYVGLVFIIALLGGLTIHESLYFPLFHILSGGLMFGAIYMATEPVTAPKTNLGRILYAAMLAVLTVLFRCIGSLPEGVATAIVTMNIFGIVINKYCIHMRVDGKIDPNEVPEFVILLLIFVIIFVYDVILMV